MTLTRRDPTLLAALILALGAHLVLLSIGIHATRRDLGWWLKSAPIQNNHPMGPVVEPKPPDPMQQLGDHDTNGTSINASPGKVPMESMVADARQEQAAMQRDPAGFGGKGTNQQLEKMLRGDNGDNRPRGQNSGGQSASAVFGSRESSEAEMSPKVNTPVPVKVKPDSEAKGNDDAVDPLSRGPLPVTPPKENSQHDEQQQSQASNNQTPSQQQQQQSGSKATGGSGGTPGSDPGAGNPLPTSDFESYPVTHIASRFVSGRIDARIGRKMRTRQLPHLGVAAYADLEGMDNPSVVLMLKIDTTGNVVDVQIEHSSGTDDVDLPCLRAAYTWWFEPMKDPKTGEIRPENIEFTIYF